MESEAQHCAENGIEFTEIRVATDALTMVTSRESEGIDCLSTDQVRDVFGPDAAQSWDQLSPDFPAEEIQVFAPDMDSGTYDFMVDEIMQLEQSRDDYNASADDNIIAQGVIGTPYSWGFFGFAFFQDSSEQLKAIEYDAGDGCVAPSAEAAQNGAYKLARPLFIYVKNSAMREEPHIADFVDYYVNTVNDVSESVGYVPLSPAQLLEAQEKVGELAEGGS